MKWYRKLNRGFVALILVLIVLITYMVVLGQNRKADEADVLRLSEDYLATAIDLEFISEELREDYRQSNQDIEAFRQSDGYTSFYNRAKSSLQPFYPADGKYLNFQMNRLERKWTEQLSSVLSLGVDYEIIKVQNVNYIDDTITITMEINYKQGDETSYGNDDIYVLKVNGEYKIIAVRLSADSFGGYWRGW